MKTLLIILAIALCVPSCSTPFGQKVITDINSPTGQKVIGALENAALQAGINALEQYSNGGRLNTNAIGLAALEGGTLGLRSMEGSTILAPTQAQITNVITDFGGSQQIAAAASPAITKAIAKAVDQGLPAKAALEHAAKGLDAVPAIVKPIK